MGLPADKWPNIHFYDVRTRKAVRLNANRTKIKLKHGSTKGRGAGEYFSVVAERPEGNLVKFLSQANFNTMKKAQAGRSSSRSPSRSPVFRGSRRRTKSARSRTMRSSKKTKCNTLKSGQKRKRTSCLRSPKCAWVPRSMRAKSYCKRN